MPDCSAPCRSVGARIARSAKRSRRPGDLTRCCAELRRRPPAFRRYCRCRGTAPRDPARFFFRGPVMIALEKISGSHTEQYSLVVPSPLLPPEYHFQLTPFLDKASAIVGCAWGGMRSTWGPSDAGSPVGRKPAL